MIYEKEQTAMNLVVEVYLLLARSDGICFRFKACVFLRRASMNSGHGSIALLC